MYDLNKKFFKLTLNTFRTCAQENPTLIEKFDVLCENINKSNQLNDVDLHEMATEYKDLKAIKQDDNKSQVKVMNQNQTKAVNNIPKSSVPKPADKGKKQAITNRKENRQMSVVKNNPIKIGNKYWKFCY